MVVDEQLVFTQRRIVHASRIANENIPPSIIINIDHHHTRAPLFFIAKSCLVRNIFAFKIAFVKVKFIAALVGSKKKFYKAIVIKITDTDYTAVVKTSVA